MSFGYFICVLILVPAIVCFSLRNLEEQSEERQTRFLVDTVHAIGGVALHFTPECLICKCYNICHSDHFGYNDEKYDFCGEKLWNSINCTAYKRTTTTIISSTASTSSTTQVNLFTATTAPSSVSIPKTTTLSSSGTKSDRTTEPTPITEILPNGTSVTHNSSSTVKGCNRHCVISSIAEARSVSSNNTPSCYNGERTGNEAFPMVCCKIESPASWRPGVQVMSACPSMELNYLPVAAFVNGDVYVPGSAGILVSCKNNEFQIAFQSCDHVPSIATVSTHQDAYYVIEQLL